jgi:hypothetical protein
MLTVRSGPKTPNAFFVALQTSHKQGNPAIAFPFPERLFQLREMLAMYLRAYEAHHQLDVVGFPKFVVI